MLKKILAGSVSALIFAGTAQAQVAVSIWTNQTAAATTPTLGLHSTLNGGVADGTTSVSAINFFSDPADGLGSPYTVGGFLNNPGGLSAALAGANLNNTYLYLTGQVALNAGNNSFVVSHDDGLQLNIDGIGLVVDEAHLSSPTDTPFNVFASSAGLYNFEMSYGEAAGPPAQLVWQINGRTVGDVPEPATWAMMLLGFGAIGVAMRRRRKPALLQMA